MTLRRTLLTGGLATGALSLTACSPSRWLNAWLPGDTHRLTADVRYGDDPRQQLDIYEPIGPAPAGGWPTVLFLYGGSWNRGSRADYRFVGEALASHGLLAFVADYRLFPQVTYPDFLHDCARALAYARHEAGRRNGDERRLFVMGHSAGAYNAAMLALDERWLAPVGLAPRQHLAGWVGLAGPYDFIPIVNPDVRPVFHHPDVPPDSQPIRFADRAGVRCFLGAARSDSLVNPERNTAQLAQRLSNAGTSVTLRWYERANHVTLAGAFARPLRWIAPVLEDVEAFVRATPAA